ncbi:phage tail protein [Serratia sp. L9]|uniref:phage tail protein n=1 Tax=Serratia sp. L9 TaxID=3423946 RepID=UPI003D66FF16
MAKNEFLPFGTASNANVLTNAEYTALPARTSGFTAGVAKAKDMNKVWRQASVIAAAVAQFIADQSEQDVLDNGDMEALKVNLQNAIKAYANSHLTTASTTVAGITKLSSETNSTSATLAATPAAVKTAMDTANAKADKNTASKNTSGWWKCASTGLIYQWGTLQGSSQYTVDFLIPFPNQLLNGFANCNGSIESIANERAWTEVYINNNKLYISCVRPGSSGGAELRIRAVHWFAIGF